MSHLARSIRIQAPVERVSALARDRRRWAEWFVGLGPARPGSGQEGDAVAVGLRFPLAQPATERSLNGLGTQWRSRSEGRGEVARTGDRRVLMTGGDQLWSYVPKGTQTELTIQLDYTLPPDANGGRPEDPRVADALAGCVEQSLAGLKRLAETS